MRRNNIAPKCSPLFCMHKSLANQGVCFSLNIIYIFHFLLFPCRKITWLRGNDSTSSWGRRCNWLPGQLLIGCFKGLSTLLPLTLIQCSRHCCMYTNQSNATLCGCLSEHRVGPPSHTSMLLSPGDETSAGNHIIVKEKKNSVRKGDI